MSNNYLTVDDQTPSRPRKTSRSHVQDKQDAGPSPLRKHSEDLTEESPAPLDSTFQKGTPTKPQSTRTRHKSFTTIDPHTLQKDHPEYIDETPTNYHGPLRPDTPDSRRRRVDSHDGLSQSSHHQVSCADPVCRMQKDMYTTLLMTVYGARAHCSCRRQPLDQLASHRHGHQLRHSITSQSPSESGYTTELKTPLERAQSLRSPVYHTKSDDLHEPRQTRRDDGTQKASNVPGAGRSAVANEARPLPPTPRMPRIHLDSEDRHVNFRSEPSIIVPGQTLQLRSAAPSSTTTKVQTSTMPPGPSPVLENLPLPPNITPAFSGTRSTNVKTGQVPEPARSAGAPGNKASGAPIGKLRRIVFLWFSRLIRLKRTTLRLARKLLRRDEHSINRSNNWEPCYSQTPSLATLHRLNPHRELRKSQRMRRYAARRARGARATLPCSRRSRASSPRSECTPTPSASSCLQTAKLMGSQRISVVKRTRVVKGGTVFGQGPMKTCPTMLRRALTPSTRRVPSNPSSNPPLKGNITPKASLTLSKRAPTSLPGP